MNNHIKQSPILSVLSLGGGSHSTLVRAAGGGLDLSNVFDFTTGSVPTGWSDAQMNNTSSTFVASTLAANGTDLPPGYSFGDMYFQRGDATNRSSFNLRYDSGFTGDYLFQLSFYSQTSSYSIPDWGIGLCDALPTERTQNFWNGVGNTTFPWWWKNGFDNGGQVGKRNRRFFCDSGVPTLYNENFGATGSTIENASYQGWKTMHFQYRPSQGSFQMYKGKVTYGQNDWAQAGTNISGVVAPNGSTSLNTTYYLGVGADNDQGTYAIANAFRFTNDSTEFF